MSLVAAPGGRGEPGPLRYTLSAHWLEHVEANTRGGCAFELAAAAGDARYTLAGPHPAAAHAIAVRKALLGLLRHGTSAAAGVLRAQGLDLDRARAELLRVGPTLGSRSDPAGALRSFGIDVEQVRGRLEAIFGADALQAAERRVRRRPRWRGGHARPSPLCVYVLAKRSFEFAVRFADERGDAEIGPAHLLYGALRDARDPLGTDLSRRSRREMATLGWMPGRPNPLRLVLEGRDIDLASLAVQLGG